MRSEVSASQNGPENELSRHDVSRRTFLKVGAAAGGGLLLSLSLPALGFEANAGTFEPNAFIRIGVEGPVILVMPYVEMGQGTYTSIPMLIAEELEIELSQVRLEHAPSNEKLYGNPILGGIQATGNSNAVRASWEPLRRAGATARTLLITAAANVWKVDTASCYAEKGEVIHAGTGRRLKYGALVGDAARLPPPGGVTLKKAGAFKIIGSSAKRLDTPSKVNGTAVYGIDVQLPGLRIATLAQSPVLGGRLKNVDDTKARAVKGVRQIVRLEDAVAVVADHMGAAKKGLAALGIQWDDGPHAAATTSDAMLDLKAALGTTGAIAQSVGDAAKAMASAVIKVEASYGVPFLAHATMEPMNCTVHARKDACDVWVGTQVMARAQAAAARAAGVPVEKAVVHNHLIGGGFGRRLEIDGIARAVEIGKQVDGPVKVIWTREEDIQHDMYRPAYADELSAGLDETGMPVAWTHRFAGSSVLSRWLPPAFKNGLDDDTTEGAIQLLYALPNIHVEYIRKEPAVIPTAFWRSVGPSHNVFVVESFMDELAAAAKKDPVDYRRALLEKSPRAKAVIELAAEKAGWGQPLAAGVGRGVSLQFAFATYMALVAEVEVSKAGEVRVRRVTCAVDCGIAVNPDTIKAQAEGGIMFGLSAALYGQITLKDGKIEQGNFDTYQVVRIDEAPAVDVHIVQSTAAPGGMGECGVSALPAAVTNAIFAATGKRLRNLPIDPALLRSA